MVVAAVWNRARKRLPIVSRDTPAPSVRRAPPAGHWLRRTPTPPTGARAMWDDLEWYLTAMYVFAVIGFLVVLGGAAWMLWRVLDAVL